MSVTACVDARRSAGSLKTTAGEFAAKGGSAICSDAEGPLVALAFCPMMLDARRMLPLSPVYFVPLGFVVFGSPFVAIGAIYKRKNTAIRTWPRVKGTIVTSAFVTHSWETLDTFDRGWAPNNPNSPGRLVQQTTHSAEARFAYQVGGRAYEGTTISREGLTGVREDVQAWVDRHPPGTQVSVYVDPQDPAKAYLEWKRFTVGSLILLIWGGVLMFIGVLIFVIFLLVGS